LYLFHDNASIYRSEAFKDGLRHGSSSEHRRDGTLRYTQSYHEASALNSTGNHFQNQSSLLPQGQRHGPRVCYADNGRTQLTTSIFSSGSGSLWLFRDK
jgi:hypothetical protein